MLYSFEFPDGFRAAAELRGFGFGRSRQPQTSAQQTDRAAVARVLQCILADFELVAPPAGGCVPCGALKGVSQGNRPAGPQLEPVIFEVMRELERRGVF